VSNAKNIPVSLTGLLVLGLAAFAWVACACAIDVEFKSRVVRRNKYGRRRGRLCHLFRRCSRPCVLDPQSVRLLETGDEDERLPVPDVTTLDGRRMYFSHIDGDGWNNISEIEGYRETQTTVADVGSFCSSSSRPPRSSCSSTGGGFIARNRNCFSCSTAILRC